MTRRWSHFALVLAVCLASRAASALDVTTAQYDYTRRGANISETVLTPANVNISTFGKLGTQPVDGQVYAQPLYLSNLTIAGGVHNVLIVCTENNSVYAFDADNPALTVPYWHRSLPPSAPGSDLGCGDLTPLVGITSTPVIDRNAGALYLVSKSKESGTYYNKLYAISITTGNDLIPPAIIQGTVAGTGDGSVGNVVTYDPLRHFNRAGLLLLNGTIYISFASHCDIRPYHGWVFAYRAIDLTRTGVLCTTPNGWGGGVWHNGGGLSSDGTSIFCETGNGTTTAYSGGNDYALSVLRLNPDCSIADWFTPSDFIYLDNNDLDLCASPVVADNGYLLAQGKQGTVYVLDGYDLSNFNVPDQIIQRYDNAFTLAQGNNPMGILWNGSYYLWPGGNGAYQYPFSGSSLNSVFATNPTSQGSRCGGVTLSANGTTAGILWGTSDLDGRFHALAAGNVSIELWNDNQAPNQRDNLVSPVQKFAVPTVANGKVYVPTKNSVVFYGLFGGSNGCVAEWKLDETSGMSAADSSGNGNTGTVSGNPGWSAGVIGGAFTCDGVSSITCGNQATLNPTAAISVSAWVKTTQDANGIAVIRHQSGYSALELLGSGQAVSRRWNAGTTNTNCTFPWSTAPGGFADGHWHHFASVYTQSTGYAIYKDGQLILSSTGSGSTGAVDATSPNPWMLGGTESGSGNFIGSLDEVQVYSLALSPGQIQTLAGAAAFVPTSLAFASQPVSTNAGAILNPVTVTVQGPTGATISGSNATVTLSLASAPGTGTLSGTLTHTVTNGVATFGDLSLSSAGAGYSLVATSPGLVSATSAMFTINAACTQPVISPTGGSFTGPVTVLLSTSTPGAVIYFTTNGAPPTTASQQYTGPIHVTATTTIAAIATSPGLSVSTTANASFTITGSASYGMPYRPLVTGLNVPTTAAAVPSTLSATNVFTSLATLTPAPGIIPYTVNTPLWSDGAVKQRWIALPGTSQILFAPTGEWTFPGGTILIKHFELGTNDADPTQRMRLETRLLVVGQNGTGYGVTYRWRSDNSDADLVSSTGLNQQVTIATVGGGTRAQTWHYPAQSECLQCHTSVAGFVLGPKTRQLNGSFTYPATGISDNQLRTWNYLQMFSSPVAEATIPSLSQMVAVGNASAPIETRVKSYLDANCAQCHRPGGAGSFWDAQFDTPMSAQAIINGTVRVTLGVTGATVATPQNIALSALHLRMVSSASANQMPPLARNVVDCAAVSVLDQWINGLPTDRSMLAWWKLDESAGTVAADATGNSNAGLVANGTWTAGTLGNALSFNAGTMQSGTGPQLTSANACTTTAWFKTTQAASTYASVIRHDGYCTPLQLRNDGNAQAVVWAGGTIQTLAFPWTGVLNTNVWHHLGVVYGSGTGVRVYIDGVLKQSATNIVGVLPTTVTAPFLLAGAGNGAESFAGLLDDVRVYNRMLSASEIGTLAHPVNAAPMVNAGVPQTITFGTPAVLAGSVVDDGLPDPPGGLTVAWSTITGPGTVTFSSSTTSCTSAYFSAPGNYTLGLTASDSLLSSSATVVVTVLSGTAVNAAPIANAGLPQTITLPGTATLTGSASDDGLPNPPGMVTYLWNVVSGPGTVTFANAAAATTTASFTSPGTYTLSLTASDSLLTGNSSVTVTVNPGQPSNLVGWWTLDDGSGSSAADSSGNGLVATLTNANWTTGILGGALGFTGNSTFNAGQSALLAPTTALTECLWFKTAQAASTYTSVLRHDGFFTGLQLASDGTAHAVAWNNGTMTQVSFPWTGVWNNNQWHHYAATYDQTHGLVIYIDGTQVTANAAMTGLLPPAPTAPFMAGGSETGTEYFTGVLDDIRLYNRALALSEIQVLAGITPVTSIPPVNSAPVVTAGVAQSITLPAGTTLVGTATDDGLPNPPAALTYQWSQTGGTGTATFAHANALTTTVSFSSSGSYTLTLTASDSVLTGTSAVVVTVNPAPVSTLVGWWTLDDGTGTSAADSSGNGLVATVTNPQWTTGKIAGALDCAGTTTVTAGQSLLLTPTSGVSECMWFKTAQAASAYTSVLRHDGYFTALQLASDGTAHAVAWNNGVLSQVSFPWSGRWNDNQWHHYAATYDHQAGVAIYIDGTLVTANATLTGLLPATPTAPFMAGGSENGNEYYTGLLDDIRVYNRALAASEVLALVSAATSVTAGNSPVNTAPTVTAGPAQSITLPGVATLTGSAVDDGLPNPPGTLTFTWSASGPGAVTFANAQSASTTASFVSPGTYTLTLTASDSVLTGTSSLPVTVYAAPSGSLVGWWTLDDGSGTTAADSSGYGLNATVTNPQWTTGKIGGALAFAGTSTVNAGHPSVLAPTGGLTECAWFKTAQAASTYTSILRHDGYFTALQLAADGTAHAVVWNKGVLSTVPFAWTGKWNDNQWHHYAATYDQSAGASVYLDGTLVASQNTLTGALPAAPTTPFMAGGSESGSELYTGLLDDIRVYSRALTATEVQMLASGLTSVSFRNTVDWRLLTTGLIVPLPQSR